MAELAPSLFKSKVSVQPVFRECLCATTDPPSSSCHSPCLLGEVGRSQSHRTDVYALGHHVILRCYLMAIET